MSHDQPDTARLIERLGIGLQIPWKQRHRHLGRAVDALLDDASFPDAARRLSDEENSRDRASLAAEALESLLGGSGQR